MKPQMKWIKRIAGFGILIGMVIAILVVIGNAVGAPLVEWFVNIGISLLGIGLCSALIGFAMWLIVSSFDQ